MAKLKHCLILALAAVFSMAGLLTLLTSPALAAAMSPDKCRNRALEIKGATLDEGENPGDILFPTDNKCTNLCTGTDEDIHITVFRRFIGQSGALGLTAFIWEFFTDAPTGTDVPTGDVMYSDSLYGTVAFFCQEGATNEIVRLGVNRPGPPASCPVISQICTDAQE